MTARLTEIFRYPIKAHGAELIETANVTSGTCLPFDRAWAAVHEESSEDGTVWAKCRNFSRGAGAPELMAISSTLDEVSGLLTLRHPNQADLTFDPNTESDAFVAWVKPLMPENRAQTTRLVKAVQQGMTDSDFPSISLASHSSRRAVSDKAGMDLSPLRFRSNLWFDGLAPWEENEWVGHRLKIGSAEFKVEERITRCLSTHANPETGERDANTLDALEAGWGHRDFSVAAVVVKYGTIRLGDTPVVIG